MAVVRIPILDTLGRGTGQSLEIHPTAAESMAACALKRLTFRIEPHLSPEGKLKAISIVADPALPLPLLQNHDPTRTLNHDHDLARSVHRVIRAMHDGECPKCHRVHPSEDMRERASAGWRCPSCGFDITLEQAEAGLALFARFMEQNLAVFEAWRSTL